MESVQLARQCLASMDCVVIATDHSPYDIVDIVAHANLVFGTGGVTRGLRCYNIVRPGE